MILCDVGNSRMHFLVEGEVVHLTHEEGVRRYGERPVRYICVSQKAKRLIDREAPAWREVADPGLLRSGYRGLGIDRVAACLGVYHGVVVDAGSAVTVDVMEEGRHLGGWIWPGLATLRGAYAAVSAVLDRPIGPDLPTGLPQNTDEALSFGVFAAVSAAIERYAPGLPVVVTGGDAPLFAAAITGACVDEKVVFRGIEKMIKETAC
ncbi:type III pantothenate kinase [Hydrogenimonas sp.]